MVVDSEARGMTLQKLIVDSARCAERANIGHSVQSRAAALGAVLGEAHSPYLQEERKSRARGSRSRV